MRLVALLLIFVTGCQSTRVSVHYRSLFMELGVCYELEGTRRPGPADAGTMTAEIIRIVGGFVDVALTTQPTTRRPDSPIPADIQNVGDSAGNNTARTPANPGE